MSAHIRNFSIIAHIVAAHRGSLRPLGSQRAAPCSPTRENHCFPDPFRNVSDEY